LHRQLYRAPRSLRAHAWPCCRGLVTASPRQSPATAVVGPLLPPRVPPPRALILMLSWSKGEASFPSSPSQQPPALVRTTVAACTAIFFTTTHRPWDSDRDRAIVFRAHVHRPPRARLYPLRAQCQRLPLRVLLFVLPITTPLSTEHRHADQPLRPSPEAAFTATTSA
jgi:hypothetical protein